MKLAIFLMGLLIPSAAALPRHITKIAVIDTGFYFQGKGEVPLCGGHKDFTIEQAYVGQVPEDINGHGTNIAGLINEYASKGSNSYCFVFLKYYSDRQTGPQNTVASTQALQYAANSDIDVINYSGGGPEFREDEYLAVRKFLMRGGLFVAAAGNDHAELTGEYTYYPAMYDPRILVVGNVDAEGHRIASSNYGKRVTVWENGFERSAFGITATGTSQATAVTTGKRVAKLKL